MLSSPSSLETRCSQAAQRILAQRGWRLPEFPALGVAPAEFARRVHRRVLELQAQGSRDPEDQLMNNAVMNQYGYLLHDALLMADISLRTEAMQELWRYLLPIAARKAPSSQAEDLTQQALLQIWRAFHHEPRPVRDPGAFLAWCQQILLREIGQWFRRPANQAAQPSPFAEDEEGDLPVAEIPSGVDADFWQLIRRCLPRADDFAVILAVFHHDISIQVLASQMKRTPNWVSLKKFNALKRLRECRELASWHGGGAA